MDVATICPLHGPILTENLSYYIGLYDCWSRYDVESEGVFVAYASIHGGTAKAAEKLADILREKGAKKVATADLTRDDMAEAARLRGQELGGLEVSMESWKEVFAAMEKLPE